MRQTEAEAGSMCILPRSAPDLIRRRGMKRIIRKMAPALCFSALIGGGALAYAALRKDEAGEYANKFGTVLLETVDKVAEALPK